MPTTSEFSTFESVDPCHFAVDGLKASRPCILSDSGRATGNKNADGSKLVRGAVVEFSPEQQTFRDTLRTFVAREITPYVNQWDEAEGFPRELYRKAAAVGLLGIGYPEHLGGIEVDFTWRLIASAELA